MQHADEDGRRNGQAADKAERDIPAHLHAFPVDAAQDDTDEDKGKGGGDAAQHDAGILENKGQGKAYQHPGYACEHAAERRREDAF